MQNICMGAVCKTFVQESGANYLCERRIAKRLGVTCVQYQNQCGGRAVSGDRFMKLLDAESKRFAYIYRLCFVSFPARKDRS
jgi:hypothetical protein